MSRIHEALKRAEEEKLAAGATAPTGVVAVPAPEAPAVHAPLPATVAAADIEVPSAAVPPAGCELLEPERALEGLRSRPQKPWKPEKSMLFLNGNSHNEPGMEEFRTLRSRLYHMRERQPLKTILVASAVPAEGKTFVAANLAQALARQHGRRTLLVDGDLRKPRLHECLGTELAPGLTDFLRGAADQFNVIQGGPMHDLFFMPGGNVVSNPAELASNGRLKDLLVAAKSVFEWIIIDSPPVVLVSDAVLMASCCDGVLLVVEAASTPYELAQKAVQELRGANMLGVVLNRAQGQSAYGSSYYYRYGKHGYGKDAKR